MAKFFEMWWPGTELNRRRQPFQTLFNPNLQQLTGLRETAKYLQIRASRSNHGLASWAAHLWFPRSSLV
jgi:hypothetical protein